MSLIEQSSSSEPPHNQKCRKYGKHPAAAISLTFRNCSKNAFIEMPYACAVPVVISQSLNTMVTSMSFGCTNGLSSCAHVLSSITVFDYSATIRNRH
jgi:hypothetical protein